jgi:hypothetical protein
MERALGQQLADRLDQSSGSGPTEPGGRLPPITSPADAMRAAIVADYRRLGE